MTDRRDYPKGATMNTTDTDAMFRAAADHLGGHLYMGYENYILIKTADRYYAADDGGIGVYTHEGWEETGEPLEFEEFNDWTAAAAWLMEQ